MEEYSVCLIALEWYGKDKEAVHVSYPGFDFVEYWTKRQIIARGKIELLVYVLHDELTLECEKKLKEWGVI